MARTYYRLTKDEWHAVRTSRGRAATGQPAQRTEFVPTPGSAYLGTSAGKTYYWCYGEQPSKGVLKKIARQCPLKAAEAYLEHYQPVDSAEHHRGYVVPKKALGSKP